MALLCRALGLVLMMRVFSVQRKFHRKSKVFKGRNLGPDRYPHEFRLFERQARRKGVFAAVICQVLLPETLRSLYPGLWLRLTCEFSYQAIDL